MKIETTPLDGLVVLTPARIDDTRGFFSETWNQNTLNAAGIHLRFVQDNHSFSLRKGTLRGLHLQRPPRAQDKLVRCCQGALFDVAVDARPGSATFGRWFGCELSADNRRQLLIPQGFLHGFVTLRDDTEIIYKCTGFYSAKDEVSVRFDDPEIGIDWPVKNIAAGDISAKDARAPFFRSYAAFDYRDAG